jgi:hypothetical protein
LGVKVQHEGPLLSLQVGYAIEAIGRRELWSLLPQVDGATARAAVRRLEANEKSRFTFVGALKIESGYAQLSYRQQLANMPADKRAGFEAQVSAEWKKTLEQEATEANKPYIKSQQKPANANPDAPLIHDPRSETADALPDVQILVANLFQLMRPAIYGTRFDAERNAAMNALLTTEFARRAFSIENHRDVKSLSELVPAYLTRVPLDAFSNNETLRFVEQEGKMVLYSVGPDGLDNWGTQIEDPTNQFNKPHLVMKNSTGDIVAGINLP